MEVDRRRLLAALAVVAAVVTATFLVVRDPGSADDDLVADGTTSTSERATTTTRRSTTTTSAAAPSSTTDSHPPATTTTRPPAPPFQASIEPVTQEELGTSWGADARCTPPAELRKLTMSHWGYDGQVTSGQLIVHVAQADRMVAVFRDIYAARFPIERMVPIAAYGADDQVSMRANNTSGYNCRTVAGSTSLSQHAFGAAVDVNPLHNPYVKGSTVDPPEGAPWANRGRDDPGMIEAGDALVQAFARQGWGWGGYWSSPDYQHFSASGS
ncbi:MAG: M15 family metallopeptidase [Acidimicrobiales bacterium]